jgi:hypothetical protein
MIAPPSHRFHDCRRHGGPIAVPNLSARTATRIPLLFLLLSAAIPAAHADPISSSYVTTDLGAGTITISAANGNTVPVDSGAANGDLAYSLPTAANGGQIVSVSNGQMAYSFTLTPATPLNAYQGIMTGFPVAQNAPVNDPNTYGNPINAYSVVLNPLMNANGIIAAIDSAGVYGHYGSESAYYVQRNPNGSLGSPVTIWNGSEQFAQGPNVGGVTIAGINNANQIIGRESVGNAGQWNAVLYDINTHTLTNLSTLPALAGYLNILPIAIDDLGRILIEADPVPGSGSAEQTLLLTPAGVSFEPLSVPAPEPGSVTVMALAMAAFALYRIRDRRKSH